jgi:acyl-CoA reductase-like NAD-dependent aldehyde dehydrogenase
MLSLDGQRSTTFNVLTVHESIAETLLTRLAYELAKLKVSTPWAKAVTIKCR